MSLYNQYFFDLAPGCKGITFDLEGKLFDGLPGWTLRSSDIPKKSFRDEISLLRMCFTTGIAYHMND